MLSRVEKLVEQYKKLVGLPWERNIAGPQRVWFVVYDKTDERKLRYHQDEFETATTNAGRKWREVDLTNAFAEWLGKHEYRDGYFEDPSEVERALPEFQRSVVERIEAEFKAGDESTVVALRGVASLFGLISVSDVVQTAEDSVRGRLLVFFPGEYENKHYWFLGDRGRSGWNYLAVPITAHEIGETP